MGVHVFEVSSDIVFISLSLCVRNVGRNVAYAYLLFRAVLSISLTCTLTHKKKHKNIVTVMPNKHLIDIIVVIVDDLFVVDVLCTNDHYPPWVFCILYEYVIAVYIVYKIKGNVSPKFLK